LALKISSFLETKQFFFAERSIFQLFKNLSELHCKIQEKGIVFENFQTKTLASFNECLKAQKLCSLKDWQVLS